MRNGRKKYFLNFNLGRTTYRKQALYVLDGNLSDIKQIQDLLNSVTNRFSTHKIC
jgi:hypothetical protein